MRRSASCLLCTVLLAASAGAPAQIYEWRDARGVLNYGDRPPSGVEARRIGSAPIPRPPSGDEADSDTQNTESAPGLSAPAQPSERLEAFRSQREAERAEQEAADQAREREEARARQCEQAHNQLAALESGQRMTRFITGGEREVLDDAARAEEIQRTHGFIANHCD